MKLGSLAEVLQAELVRDIIGFVMFGSLKSSVDFDWFPPPA